MPLYLYRIEPARPGMPDAPTETEQALVGAHFEYLKAAYASGTVKYVGRTRTAPHLGLALFEAGSEEDARAFLGSDPAVAANVFRGLVQPFLELMPMLPPPSP